VSSCQCHTSPGTEGTGVHGHVSGVPGDGSKAGCSDIASPSLRADRCRAGADRRGSTGTHPDRNPDGPQKGESHPGVCGVHTVAVQEMLRALSRVSLADRALEDVLTEIVRIASTGIPGAESTSITLIRGDEAFTAAHDGDMALAADELQYERGYGPCMDAGRGNVVLRVDDMATETRWPDYSARVLEVGVRSSLSVPLPYQGTSIGALNIYSTQVGGFQGEENLSAATQVAEVVAVAIANADAHAQVVDQAHNMRRAMESRAVIEQAKGVLMAQRGVDAQQAFDMLREASQRYNRKLRDIAAGIVASTEGRR
jgi:putative methionine-R-sulfoxide reductase with GAF domain